MKKANLLKKLGIGSLVLAGCLALKGFVHTADFHDMAYYTATQLASRAVGRAILSKDRVKSSFRITPNNIRNYLNEAYLKMDSYFNLEQADDTSNDMDNALRTHRALCLERSIATYSVFRELVEKKHSEMIDSIRVVLGKVKINTKNRKDSGNHAWVEIKLGDSWVVYETNIRSFRGKLLTDDKGITYRPISKVWFSNGRIYAGTDWVRGITNLALSPF